MNMKKEMKEPQITPENKLKIINKKNMIIQILKIIIIKKRLELPIEIKIKKRSCLL
jgi:hypothetical protein